MFYLLSPEGPLWSSPSVLPLAVLWSLSLHPTLRPQPGSHWSAASWTGWSVIFVVVSLAVLSKMKWQVTHWQLLLATLARGRRSSSYGRSSAPKGATELHNSSFYSWSTQQHFLENELGSGRLSSSLNLGLKFVNFRRELDGNLGFFGPQSFSIYFFLRPSRTFKPFAFETLLH